MLAQSAKHAARVDGGLRRLWWFILDSIQIGCLAALPLAPVETALWTTTTPLRLMPIAFMAAGLVVCLRRSFTSSFFAKETMASLMIRSFMSAVMVFGSIAAFTAPYVPFPAVTLWRVGICGLVSALISLVLTWSLARWSAKTGTGTAAVAVVGDPQTTANVIAALRAGRWPGWTARLQLDSTNRADIEQLRIAVASGEIDVVIIAVGDPAEQMRDIVNAMPDATARICVALYVPQQKASDTVIWLVDLWRNPHEGVRGAVKRVLDKLVVVVLLIALAPFLALVALAIRLESPGPILFRQWRFGVCSRPFEILKFRTMRVNDGDAKGASHTQRHDPRVTRIGRLLRRSSIDELPQFYNVLIGDMSLVGPRAQALYMQIDGDLIFEALGDYPARHRVLPGITGWAQMNGSRGEVDTLAKGARRTQLDLWYIKNWSLFLDLRILLRTVFGGFLNIGAD